MLVLLFLKVMPRRLPRTIRKMYICLSKVHTTIVNRFLQSPHREPWRFLLRKAFSLSPSLPLFGIVRRWARWWVISKIDHFPAFSFTTKPTPKKTDFSFPMRSLRAARMNCLSAFAWFFLKIGFVYSGAPGSCKLSDSAHSAGSQP